MRDRTLREWRALVRERADRDWRELSPDVVDELACHLADLHASANGNGASEEDARRLALDVLNSASFLELSKRPRARRFPGGHMHAMIQSLRYGFRSLIKTPLLSVVTMVTLAIGIGLNAGIFSVVNGMMFRARVEKDPGSFVQLASKYSGTHKQRGEIRAFTTPDFEAFRTRSQSLSDVVAWRDVHLHFANDARNTLAVLVTCEFFNLYGRSRPLKGRLFSADECSAHDSPRVVLLSEELWQRRFFADPDVVGKLAYLDDVPYTIVGIIPHGFSGRLRGPGIWLPWTSSAQSQQKPTSSNKAASAWLNVEGRLKPGISAASARAELGLIARDQDRLYPGRTTTVSLTNGSFAQDPAIKGTATLVVLLVMGSLLLVVLIACVNVTTLLLSRAASRRSELAVRLSLGASRGRLIGMLTAEGMPLAVLAGGLGMLLASGTPSLFRMIMPADAPHYPMQMGSTEFMYLIG